MATGRPTKYQEHYPDLLEEHMANGYPFETFGAILTPRVGRATLYRWVDQHKSFRDAKRRGESAGELFWIKLGIKGMTGGFPKFTPAPWIFMMKCRFGYREPSDDAPRMSFPTLVHNELRVIEDKKELTNEIRQLMAGDPNEEVAG